MTATRFDFRHDPRFERALALLGVTPVTCWVEVGEDALEIRYGRWRLRTGRDNVAGAEVSGPYRPVKAIGPRLSLADRGVTFGTSAHGGTCVRFHEPVPVLLGSHLPHPGATVTVADPGGLARMLAG